MVSNDVESFLTNIKPALTQRDSRFNPYLDDLIKLQEARCTLTQISEFLSQRGINAKPVVIGNYLRRKKGKISDKVIVPAVVDMTAKSEQAQAVDSIEQGKNAKADRPPMAKFPSKWDKEMQDKVDLVALKDNQ